jgi:hypothetical protein
MKLAAFCVFFALTLSAQATTEDVVSRLDSTLRAIGADKVHEPISMVIAVQTNRKLQATMLISFRTIGSMVEPLASAGPGEIEVLSYGDRVRVLAEQPFTSDSRQAAQAMAYLKISTGLPSPTSNMFDAIAQATSDLETRPSDRRRIIVVIGEGGKDSENDAKLKDAVNRAARSNVAIFFVAP